MKNNVPHNISASLKQFSNFIELLNYCYSTSMHEYKTKIERKNVNIEFKSIEFEKNIFEAFNTYNYYDANQFTNYIKEVVFLEPDQFTIEKYFNLILLEIERLKAETKRQKYNFTYPHYKTLFDEFNLPLMRFINEISWGTDENGNYTNTDKLYFTSDEFINGILLELNKIEKSIKSIFEFTFQTYPEITTETTKLKLREIALLYYFKGEKITFGNQNTFAKKHEQSNKAGKLYTEHYSRIINDAKEILEPKRYAKKYLTNIKKLIHNKETIKLIDTYILKCR